MAATLLQVAPPAFAQEAASAKDYRQSAAVLARYPEIAIALRTPALEAGRQDFTGQDEMQVFLADIARRAEGRALLGDLGRSHQGRGIPYLVFKAADAKAPVLWLIGQQHGDEPAGAEALLAVAAALTDGELAPLGHKVTVVIAPRLNPDGAAAARRGVAGGADMNRDHHLTNLPETRALLAGMRQLRPDVVLDFHEFSVAGRWLARFGALQGVDAMVQTSSHPLVAPALTGSAERDVIPALARAWAAQGVTSAPYHLVSADAKDPAVASGGGAPGIARNAFGLMGAVSILIETRGAGIGREGLQRRVATHYLAAKTVIEMAAAGYPFGALGRDTVGRAGERLMVASEPDWRPFELNLIDPATGLIRRVATRLRDSGLRAASVVRDAPAGYLLDAEAHALAEIAAAKGILVCRLPDDRELLVESYRLRRIAGAIEPEGINPARAISAETLRRPIRARAGQAFVPLRQRQAGAVAALFEPETPGGAFAAGRVSLVGTQGFAPIHRVLRENSGLAAQEVENSAIFCPP